MSVLKRISLQTESDWEYDVVFVHGLGDKCDDCFRHRSGKNSQFWPEWLAKDLEHAGVKAAIHTLDYDTAFLNLQKKRFVYQQFMHYFILQLNVSAIQCGANSLERTGTSWNGGG